jgi:CheY-like chemotaxis protein
MCYLLKMNSFRGLPCLTSSHSVIMKVTIYYVNLFAVTVTENGKAAYEELKDENKDFDLVLLDLYMPELDGFELLSLMQEDERLRTIPVVVMTANDTNDIAANCLKMGAVNFLVKPIRIQECKALVKHMKQT